MSKNLDLSLYLILDPPMCGGFSETLAVTQQALASGVSMIQLRAPTLKKKAWYELGLALKPLCARYEVPLIINDHLDIALAVDADGVHIGQDDLPVSIARQLLGDHKIIGLSVTNQNEAIQASELSVDYVGIGPVFDTSTKKDAAAALGFDEAKKLVHICRHPSVLIGGLKLEHIDAVKTSGANGICVVSAICADRHPGKIAQQMKALWNGKTE